MYGKYNVTNLIEEMPLKYFQQLSNNENKKEK